MPQVFGITVRPEKTKVKIKAGVPYFIPCQLENIGNGTDTIAPRFDKKQSFLEVALIVDENKDGIHTNSETSPVPTKIKMGEGAVYNFFIRLTAASAMVSQAEADIKVSFSASSADGPAYVGYNGARYGGADNVSVTVQAQVE